MKRVCLLACCAVLGGCMHAAPVAVKEPAASAVKQERPELSAALVEKTIVKGKTTKQEILAKLGAPNGASANPRRPSAETTAENATLAPIDRATEYWNYWTSPPMEALGKSDSFRIFRLTVYFDDKGVVLDYQTGESTVNLP